MKRVNFLSIWLIFLIAVTASAVAETQSATISPALYQKIQNTERLIADKAYTKAEQQLLSMLGDVKSGSLDQAVIFRSLASVYSLREQHAKAAEWLAKAVALKMLPDKQQQAALFNLGQLYLSTESYAQAIEILKPWLAKNSVPDASFHVLLANAYTQLKQYRNALPHIAKAIQSAPKPEASWYQLQLALFFELKDFQSAIPLLRKLLADNPSKKEYWTQLILVYQQANQLSQAATIKHLAYKKGVLNSEQDAMELVNLYLYAGLPYKAAAFLENALNTKQLVTSVQKLELLANAWRQAKELSKAVIALEKASKLADKGGLYQTLGQIFYEQENWTAAIDALNKALVKGDLKRPGQTYMILGLSYYESHKTDQARQAFVKATRFPDNKKDAEQWLRYLNQGGDAS